MRPAAHYSLRHIAHSLLRANGIRTRCIAMITGLPIHPPAFAKTKTGVHVPGASVCGNIKSSAIRSAHITARSATWIINAAVAVAATCVVNAVDAVIAMKVADRMVHKRAPVPAARGDT